MTDQLTQFMLNSPALMFIAKQNVGLLLPEIVLLTSLLFCVLASFGKTLIERQSGWWFALLGTVSALGSLVYQYAMLKPLTGSLAMSQWQSYDVLNGMLQIDLFGFLVRFLLMLGAVLLLLQARQYVNTRFALPAEFYVCLLTALLGGLFLASSLNLVMLFVAIETLGIASYILVGFLRGNALSAEAALKYLVYGGASTAVLLMGFSLLYGLTGGLTDLPAIAQFFATPAHSPSGLSAIMLVLILGGLAFKLSLAPFHMWTPDVYEGAPTPVTAFLSVISKTAAFAITVRLLYTVLPQSHGLVAVLAALSALSMTWGNFAALRQSDIKRLLGFSTVAHAGYMLTGVLMFSAMGLASVLYYLAAYLFMNLGAFAAVGYTEALLGSTKTADFAGLIRKRPGLAVMLTMFLLSLAGIPITAGFFAKMFLFQALSQSGTQWIWLIVVALLNSTVGLYYYLRIIRLMIIDEPSSVVAALQADVCSPVACMRQPLKWAMILCLVGTLGLGFWAEPMLGLSKESAVQLKLPLAPVSSPLY